MLEALAWSTASGTVSMLSLIEVGLSLFWVKINARSWYSQRMPAMTGIRPRFSLLWPSTPAYGYHRATLPAPQGSSEGLVRLFPCSCTRAMLPSEFLPELCDIDLIVDQCKREGSTILMDQLGNEPRCQFAACIALIVKGYTSEIGWVRFICLWDHMSMGLYVYEIICWWDYMSMELCVYGIVYLWACMSIILWYYMFIELYIYGIICLWGCMYIELYVYEIAHKPIRFFPAYVLNYTNLNALATDSWHRILLLFKVESCLQNNHATNLS